MWNPPLSNSLALLYHSYYSIIAKRGIQELHSTGLSPKQGYWEDWLLMDRIRDTRNTKWPNLSDTDGWDRSQPLSRLRIGGDHFPCSSSWLREGPPSSLGRWSGPSISVSCLFEYFNSTNELSSYLPHYLLSPHGHTAGARSGDWVISCLGHFLRFDYFVPPQAWPGWR